MFDDSVMDLLVTETNRYAKQNPPGDRYRWYDTSDNELKLFLGMIIAMGIHRLPQLEDYWCSDPLLGVPGIVSGMPIDRFKVLLQCMNRDDPDYDRLHKIRPLISMARENFMKEYQLHREISIDEAMVVLKGRVSIKQYMPLKPTKRGYKIWCLCDAHNGYLWNFQVYTGAGSKDGKGLGDTVVKTLSAPLAGDGHFIFCDNFFSSVTLAKDLLEKDTYICGTTRSNRKKFPSVLKSPKLKRGESFINTIYCPNDSTEVKRRNKDGSQSDIPCPASVTVSWEESICQMQREKYTHVPDAQRSGGIDCFSSLLTLA